MSRKLLILLYCSSFIVSDSSISSEFLVIGHKGSPFHSPENTISSFQAALNEGANALELDVGVTKDGQVVVIHDIDPDGLVAQGRQSGLEGLPYIPVVPEVGSPWRRPVRQLTLEEVRAHNKMAIFRGAFEAPIPTPIFIPTLMDFANWAEHQQNLKAIIVDIKIGPEDKEAMKILCKTLIEMAKNSHYLIYASTIYKKLFTMLSQELSKNIPIGRKKSLYFGLDFETDILNNDLDDGPSLLLMGNTPVRPTNGFMKNLKKTIDQRQAGEINIFPIIAWTIDDPWAMYRIIKMGADGIITNRPHYLKRIKDRAFQDYQKIGHAIIQCVQDFQGTDEWQLCASGKELSPLLPINLSELKSWACKASADENYLKNILGCGHSKSVIPLEFKSAIDDSGSVNIWYRPGKNSAVVVARSQEQYSQDKLPFILQFKQKSCHDGMFDSACEYRVYVEYQDEQERFLALKNNIPQNSSNWDFISSVPLHAKALRVTLWEMDNGKVVDRKSKSQVFFPLLNGQKVPTVAENQKFSGELLLRIFKYDQLENEWSYFRRVGLRYHQDHCNDGILNHQCEYEIRILHSSDGKSFWPLKQSTFDANNSFTLYLNIPKTTRYLKIEMNEMDDGVPNAKGTAIIDSYGEFSYTIDSHESTFSGRVWTILDQKEAIK